MSNAEKLDPIYLQKLFEEENNLQLKRVVGVITNFLTIPLFMSFCIYDYFYTPEIFKEIFLIRLFCIPVTLICKFLIKKHNTYQNLQLISLFFTTAIASLINIMTFYSGDIYSYNFVGLILAAFAALSFVPFNTTHYVLASFGIFLPHLIFFVLNASSQADWNFLVVSGFLMISACVICGVIRYFNQKMLMREVILKQNLKSELESREEIIKKQSLEVAKIHQLSSQFSPQVVEAIRSGDLELDKGLSRTEICAIFIDIVKSTEKVVRLPENKVQATLARFLDTVMTIFLKYDLTIDKFHGDGVLAFANSPVKHEDYIERTCLAAIEAREALLADRDFYIANWKSEMQIRIGISAGIANVGFYGDKKFFKTFSAIGVPLPFASRLTSLAEPGQILVDSDIAKALSKNKFYLKNLGEKNIKGFEEDINIVFELINSGNHHVQKAA